MTRRKRIVQTGDAALPAGPGKIRALKGEVAS